MDANVYKVVELVGSSQNSIEEAIENAIKKASESLRKMRWFEVDETRGVIDNGEVAYYQVRLRLGFTVDD